MDIYEQVVTENIIHRSSRKIHPPVYMKLHLCKSSQTEYCVALLAEETMLCLIKRTALP